MSEGGEEATAAWGEKRERGEAEARLTTKKREEGEARDGREEDRRERENNSFGGTGGRETEVRKRR